LWRRQSAFWACLRLPPNGFPVKDRPPTAFIHLPSIPFEVRHRFLCPHGRDLLRERVEGALYVASGLCGRLEELVSLGDSPVSSLADDTILSSSRSSLWPMSGMIVSVRATATNALVHLELSVTS
jgi:hypothetical protein